MGSIGAIPAMLDERQLTGRSRGHVRDYPDLGCALHPLAAEAFGRMVAAAAAEGIGLTAVSGFRDFDRQLAIWNDKYAGRRPLLDRAGVPLDAARLDEAARVEAILWWSALPGASRHHWGSDCDVIDRAAHPPGEPVDLVPRHYAPDGRYARLADWLSKHAGEYGFFLPYDMDRGGVQVEPWHLSYAPVAVPALAALDAGLLERALGDSGISGWDAIRPRLAGFHARFVAAVAAPVSPGARPA